jgi:hypothetical protein
MAGSGGKTFKKNNETASTKLTASSIKSLAVKASTKLKSFGKTVINSISPKKKSKKQIVPDSDSSDGSIIEVEATSALAPKGSSKAKKCRIESDGIENEDEAEKEGEPEEVLGL